jgi:hypothetical protein
MISFTRSHGMPPIDLNRQILVDNFNIHAPEFRLIYDKLALHINELSTCGMLASLKSALSHVHAEVNTAITNAKNVLHNIDSALSSNVRANTPPLSESDLEAVKNAVCGLNEAATKLAESDNVNRYKNLWLGLTIAATVLGTLVTAGVILITCGTLAPVMVPAMVLTAGILFECCAAGLAMFPAGGLLYLQHINIEREQSAVTCKNQLTEMVKHLSGIGEHIEKTKTRRIEEMAGETDILVAELRQTANQNLNNIEELKRENNALKEDMRLRQEDIRLRLEKLQKDNEDLVNYNRDLMEKNKFLAENITNLTQRVGLALPELSAVKNQFSINNAVV